MRRAEGASAMCICPIWVTMGSTSSLSSTSRRFARKGSSSTSAITAGGLSINSFSRACGGGRGRSVPPPTWEPGTIPANVFYGHMACITNHFAASDGDFFSYFFKQYKLGPLIGERTWGGVRGIRGNIPLMDGGYITRPEFSLYSLDSKWLIENRGVQPDVVVDNPPDLVLKGQDPQLEKAVEMLMEQIKANPKKLPAPPPDLPAYPDGPGL